MAERAKELRTVQVVQADCAIETGGGEQAHLVTDEDGGDLPVVVVQLLEHEPRGSLAGLLCSIRPTALLARFCSALIF